MQKILDAILADELDAIGSLPVPTSYRGITVHADEATMFDGMESSAKDPRRSLHLDEVPTPELGPGEALVAVINKESAGGRTDWTAAETLTTISPRSVNFTALLTRFHTTC